MHYLNHVRGFLVAIVHDSVGLIELDSLSVNCTNLNHVRGFLVAIVHDSVGLVHEGDSFLFGHVSSPLVSEEYFAVVGTEAGNEIVVFDLESMVIDHSEEGLSALSVDSSDDGGEPVGVHLHSLVVHALGDPVEVVLGLEEVSSILLNLILFAFLLKSSLQVLEIGHLSRASENGLFVESRDTSEVFNLAHGTIGDSSVSSDHDTVLVLASEDGRSSVNNTVRASLDGVLYFSN